MWEIKGKDNTIKATAKAIEYNGEWLGGCNVMVSMESPVPIDFEIGDWILYRGERFEINYNPGKIKSAPRYKSSDAFKYENIKFNSLADELARCDFLDIVLNDNQIHFTSLPRVTFYAASVKDLADRIKANLDRCYPGLWTVEVHPEYADKTDVNVTIEKGKVWDALKCCVNDFGAYFTITGRHIVIGTAGVPVPHLFMYGKGNGLYEIEQNAEPDQLVCTRVRGYGSSRNLPHRYYHRFDTVPNNMAVNFLMLPGFPEETLDPYIDSKNIGSLGIREHSVFFDGTEQGLEEIYPSLEGMTAEELKEAGLTCNSTGELDVIVSADTVIDDGVGTLNGDQSELDEKDAYFKVRVKDLGFDINDNLIEGNSDVPTISFKSGKLGGRDFEIVSCNALKSGDSVTGYELELKRVFDDAVKLWFPYKDYNVGTGDKFVLLSIGMPDAYIKTASQRLKAAVENWLSKHDYSRSIYNPRIDELFMARQHDAAMASKGVIKSLHDSLKEGMQLLFEDGDLKINAAIFIEKLVIKESENAIPTYEVTLKEEKTVGTLEKIQNQIDSLSSGGQGGGYTADQIKALIDAYGGIRFLSKIKADRTPYALSVGGKLTAEEEIGSKDFAEGLTGFGWKGNKEGHFDLESLTLRKFLEVPELRNNRVSVVMGTSWRSPGLGIVEQYEHGSTLSNGRSTGTIILKLEEGDIGAVAVGDMCMGIWHYESTGQNATEDSDDGKGNFAMAGFTTVYFEITAVRDRTYTDPETGKMKTLKNGIIDIKTRPGWKGLPAPGMHFTGYSSFTDKDRITSEYSTRTYTRYIKGVGYGKDSNVSENWEIGPDNIMAQFGDLSNLEIGGVSMRDYSVYLSNVYFTGVIKQLQDARPVMTLDTWGDPFVGDGKECVIVPRVIRGFTDISKDCAFVAQTASGEVRPASDSSFITLGKSALGGNASYKVTVTATYTDPDTNTEYTATAEVVIQNYDSLKGQDGTSVGISSTSVTYQAHTSGTTPPTGTWLSSPPTVTQGMYLWTRTIVTYSDGKKTTSYSVSYIGKNGEADTVISTSVKYAVTKTANQPLDAAFTYSSVPALSPGDYLWSRTTVEYSGGQSVTSYSVSRIGADGEGLPGEDGKTSYLHIAYANSADGREGFSTTYFKDALYIGTCTDFNTADPTMPEAYEWARLRGADGTSAYVLDVDNENVPINCDSTGKAYQSSLNRKVTASVYFGSSVDTSNWTFNRTSHGCSSTISGNVITITAISEDNAYIDVEATHRTNGMKLTCRIIVYKVYAGADGTDSVNWEVRTEFSSIQRDADGNLKQKTIKFTKIKTVGNAAPSPADDCALAISIERSGGAPTTNEVVSRIGAGSEFTLTIPDNAVLIIATLLDSDTLGGKILDQETVPVVSDGKDGQDGHDGADAQTVEWETSPSVIRCSDKGVPRSLSLTVRAFHIKGSARMQINTQDSLSKLRAQYRVSYRNQLGSPQRGSWQDFGTGERVELSDTMYYPTVELRAVDTEGAVVSERQVDYVCDGAQGESGTGIQGAVVRVRGQFVPGMYYDGTKADAAGMYWLDVVWMDSADGRTRTYYRCRKTADYTSSMAPSPSSANWEEFSYISALFTDILLANNAYIKFVSGSELIICDDAGQVWGRIGSPINAGSALDIIQWFGGRTISQATYTLDKNGRASFGKINGECIIIDPVQREIRVYDSEPKCVVHIDGKVHELKDEFDLGTLPLEISTLTSGNSKYTLPSTFTSNAALDLGTVKFGDKGGIVEVSIPVSLQAQLLKQQTSSGTGITGRSYATVTVALGITDNRDAAVGTSSMISCSGGDAETSNPVSTSYGVEYRNASNSGTLRLSETLGKGTYNVRLVVRVDVSGSVTNTLNQTLRATGSSRVSAGASAVEPGDDPKCFIGAMGAIFAKSPSSYLRAGVVNGSWMVEMMSRGVGLRVRDGKIEANEGNGWGELKLSYK